MFFNRVMTVCVWCIGGLSSFVIILQSKRELADFLFLGCDCLCSVYLDVVLGALPSFVIILQRKRESCLIFLIWVVTVCALCILMWSLVFLLVL